MAKSVRFFIKSFVFLALLCGLVTGGLLYMLYHSDGGTEIVDVIIPRGASLNSVSQLLAENGVISNPGFFKLVLRLSGGKEKVRAGEFRFKQDMRAIDALFVVYNAEPIVHQITVPEGWTVRQIAAILASSKLVDEQKFLDLALTPDAAARFHYKAPSLEGFLFPDTYAFSKVDGGERILERMVQRFNQKVGKELRDEATSKGWTIEQVVTLGSIIEKETGAAGERELISSVFHNRLGKKMRLQSDPTTIYGIPNFNGNLTRADLQRPSAYNTYTIFGLPPGAIANPGLAAMQAVLHPKRTNYLYFVSNNKGGHIFSETYGQHSRHVNSWQKEYFTGASKESRNVPKKAKARTNSKRR